MLLRCFRIDRIYRAITEYVTKCMGEKYVTPPIISYEAIFEQSTPMSPIVFILSPGSDPASDLMKLAERIEFGSNKIKFLSMGQGQEKVCCRKLSVKFFLFFMIQIIMSLSKYNQCYSYFTCRSCVSGIVLVKVVDLFQLETFKTYISLQFDTDVRNLNLCF